MFFNVRLRRYCVVACAVLATAAGCPRKNVGEGRSPPPAAPSPPAAEGLSRRPAAKPEDPPPPPTIPVVSMSDEIRAACLVNVGEAMPTAELTDFSGVKHRLESLFGERLTVLCFWTIGTTRRSQLIAAAALKDLEKDIAEPFASLGVRVAAVNVGDPPDEAKRLVEQAGVALPCLSDPQGNLFARLSKDRKMPRVYLLDAEGKVLWFDVEYARPSREDLVQGIRAALGPKK